MGFQIMRMPTMFVLRKGGDSAVSPNQMGIIIPVLALDNAEVETRTKDETRKEWVIGSIIRLDEHTVIEVKEGQVAFLALVFKVVNDPK